MAIGEFGNVIDQALVASQGLSSPPEEVNTGVWIVSQVYNSSLEVYSYSSDDDGNITTKGHLTISNVTTGATFVKKISDGVFAIAYRRYSVGINQYKVVTLAVNADASVISVIADTVLDTGNYAYPNGYILCVGTGVYAYLGNSGWTFRIVTTNISDDGTTITKAAVYSLVLSAVQDANIYSIADDKYLVAMHERNQNYKVRTFTITELGAISLVATSTLDSSSDNAPRIVSACQVDGIVWAIAYAASDNFRVRTLQINTDGTFGDVIDYSDGLFSADHVYQLLHLSSTVYILSTGDSGGATINTIFIDDDGTIGTTQDTFSELVAFMIYIAYHTGSVYVGWYHKTNFQSWAFSVDIAKEVRERAFITIIS